jgi:hypothetical protein
MLLFTWADWSVFLLVDVRSYTKNGFMSLEHEGENEYLKYLKKPFLPFCLRTNYSFR